MSVGKAHQFFVRAITVHQPGSCTQGYSLELQALSQQSVQTLVAASLQEKRV